MHRRPDHERDSARWASSGPIDYARAVGASASLPAMVRTLAALERDLGATLVNRTTRSLHLTDDGQQYLEQCRAILGQVQEAEAMLQSRRAAPRGRVAITASVSFGRRHVAPIASEFVRRHPGVCAELLFVDRVVNLVEEGLDAAVRIGHLGDSSLVAIPLGKVRRVVCASPAYLRRHGVPRTPQELRGHRCIRLTGLAPRNEWPFRENAHCLSVPIDSVLTCNLSDAAIDACADGLGVGAFLSYMVAPLRRAGELANLLEGFELEPLPVQFVYPGSRMPSTTVRALAELCVARMRRTQLDRRPTSLPRHAPHRAVLVVRPDAGGVGEAVGHRERRRDRSDVSGDLVGKTCGAQRIATCAAAWATAAELGGLLG